MVVITLVSSKSEKDAQSGFGTHLSSAPDVQIMTADSPAFHAPTFHPSNTGAGGAVAISSGTPVFLLLSGKVLPTSFIVYFGSTLLPIPHGSVSSILTLVAMNISQYRD